MRIGLQLGIRGYGAMGQLPERDLATAVRMAGAASFSGVEVMVPTVLNHADAWSTIADNGLTCSGFHVFFHELDTALRLLDRAGHADVTTIVSFDEGASDDNSPAVATRLATLRAEGRDIRFHPHDADLWSRTGGSLVDHLLDRAPDVEYVLDTYWTARAGKTVVDLSGRLQTSYVHAKDGRLSEGLVARLGDGDVAVLDQVRVLAPVLDWVVYENDNPADDIVADLAHASRFLRDALSDV